MIEINHISPMSSDFEQIKRAVAKMKNPPTSWNDF